MVYRLASERSVGEEVDTDTGAGGAAAGVVNVVSVV